MDLPDPRPGEIVVRTLYSGISPGTELLAYRGEIDPTLPLDETIGSLAGTFSYPFRYGYSCVGVVEQAAADIAAGSLVFGFHPHQDRFVCRAEEAIVLADIDPRLATMFPLVETALQIAVDAGEVFEEPVAVVGLGPVGLLVCLLLQRGGADVLAIEPNETRRNAAESLDILAIPSEEAVDHVTRTTGGNGIPLVVEVSGNPAALAPALDMLAHEGTALVASWYGTKSVTLPLGGAFHRRRLSIRSTQVSTIPAHLSDRWTIERRRSVAARLLGELPLKALASADFPFEDAARAFESLDHGSHDLIHVALAYERR